MLLRLITRCLAAVSIALLASPALAANILFVSDSGADESIVGVLEADGHTVTLATRAYTGGSTAALIGDLSGFDAVYWSATGDGIGSIHDALTTDSVATYVEGGGRVFVTGYDSVASPTDTGLIELLGGSGSANRPAAPAAALDEFNPLTFGVVDIRGVAPTGGPFDRDALTGVGSDAVVVVGTADDGGEAQWTTRFLGRGIIAYVSSGSAGDISHGS